MRVAYLLFCTTFAARTKCPGVFFARAIAHLLSKKHDRIGIWDEAGDVWRACTVKKAPIENWIQLAMDRQRLTGSEAIFWLDENRAHDAQLIAYVRPVLEAAGVADKFAILAPREATRQTLQTITAGEDSIAITGNVLRDYLTDLFPILELGTSAKMLSIVIALIFALDSVRRLLYQAIHNWCSSKNRIICSISRLAKNFTAGIWLIFRG